MDITTNIVRDATAYKLKCEPNLDTLEVIFQTTGDDPISVPQADVNTGGWTYIETNKSLKFSEPYVPVDGTNVSVNYTGYTLNCENQ